MYEKGVAHLKIVQNVLQQTVYLLESHTRVQCNKGKEQTNRGTRDRKRGE